MKIMAIDYGDARTVPIGEARNSERSLIAKPVLASP